MILKQSIIKSGIYLLLTFGIWVIFYLDVFFPIEGIHHKFSELSLTEIVQEIILFIIATVFLLTGVRTRPRRSFGLLLAGFFCMAFIRELDALFDYVWHGFWKVPCLMAALAFGSFAYRYKENFVADATEFVELPAFGIFLCGFLTVFVFSRLLGCGFLWEELVGNGCIRCAKNMVEEGLELFGYFLTGIAAVEYYVFCSRKRITTES